LQLFVVAVILSKAKDPDEPHSPRNPTSFFSQELMPEASVLASALAAVFAVILRVRNLLESLHFIWLKAGNLGCVGIVQDICAFCT
jgi:hypothetical protein